MSGRQRHVMPQRNNMKNALFASTHPCYQQNRSYVCDCGNISHDINEHRKHLFASRPCLKENATLGDKHWVVEQEIFQQYRISSALFIFNDDRKWVGVIYKNTRGNYSYFMADTHVDCTIFEHDIADWSPSVRKAKELFSGNFYGNRWKQVEA